MTAASSVKQEAFFPPKKALWFNIVICLIITGTSLWMLEYSSHQAAKKAEHNQVLEELTVLRTRFENLINQNLNLSQGMATYIASNPDINQSEYSAFGEQLLNRQNNIINIGAAKDMVITLIYPIEGNEKALGLDYRKQQITAFEALQAGQTILDGPIDLVQGGVGLIARQPIYLNQGEEIWGILSTVMAFDTLIKDAGLNDATHLKVTLTNKGKPDSGDKIIWSNQKTAPQTPITQSVNLPYGKWVIAASPNNGWFKYQPTPLIWGLALIIIFFWISLARLSYKSRKRQQKDLSRSLANAERFRNIFETHDAVMLLIESNSGSIIDANDSALKFYGYSHRELSNMNINSINMLSREEILEERTRATRGNKNYFIFPHQLKSGEVRMVEVHSSPVTVNNTTLLFSIIHDITDRFENEKKLKLDAVVFANSQEGIMITDKNQRIISVNQAFEDITGYSVEESLGQKPSFLISKKHSKDFFCKTVEYRQRNRPLER